MKSRLALLALAAALAASLGASAQDEVRLLRDRAEEERPALLVLGAMHFANPGLDMINVEVENLLSDHRQTEIAAAVDELAAWAPTRIAVEWPEAAQAALDEAYRAYRAGDRALEVREAEQLGFRLAAQLGHERVYAVDWNGAGPGEQAAYDWPAWAEANGQGARVAAIADPTRLGSIVALEEQSVGAWLRALNAPERLLANHRIYFDIAAIGDDEAQPGATWVGHWYARNLRIFDNLVDLAPSPEDRVLVIYGQGHAHLLRQFAEESGAFALDDVENVLSGR
jgi:hypothetical protein